MRRAHRWTRPLLIDQYRASRPTASRKLAVRRRSGRACRYCAEQDEPQGSAARKEIPLGRSQVGAGNAAQNRRAGHFAVAATGSVEALGDQRRAEAPRLVLEAKPAPRGRQKERPLA